MFDDNHDDSFKLTTAERAELAMIKRRVNIEEALGVSELVTWIIAVEPTAAEIAEWIREKAEKWLGE